MTTTPMVPISSARGRLRSGSFTSPLTNDRSPQPSYAHSTDTSARPKGPTWSAVPPATKWPKSPWPATNASTTRRASAAYRAPVVRFTSAAIQSTPRKLTSVFTAMAAAAM